MSSEESLKSLSLDYLNLLINGQAFSDVAFSVDGRLVHAHRCVLAARSLFFRRLFCGPDPPPGLHLLDPHRHPLHHHHSPRSPTGQASGRGGVSAGVVIPLNSVGYEAFLLLLQFLYSGQVSVVPPKHEPRPDCSERGCWHTHCTSAIDLALDTLSAARSFGIEQLALITQKQLESMVEKASIKDVMKVLMASHKQDMHQLWTTCSHLIADSGLPPEVLGKHLPMDIVAKIEELRLKPGRPTFLTHHPNPTHHYLTAVPTMGPDDHHKIRRMRRALDSSDIELVKLMVMGEGLDLDDALALHYAVQNCSREVVKALLELGAADVNCPAGPAGKTPLHIAAEMVNPDMVAVLLDHHADPNVRTVDGVTPLDILRNLTSDFLFKGAVPGLSHIEPNKLRLCLELVQSAAMVISREEEAAAAAAAGGGASGGNDPNPAIYQPMSTTEGSDCNANNTDSSMVSLSLDSRMVYLNLGMAAAAHLGCKIDDGRQGSNGSRSQGGSGIGPSSMFSHHDFP
ncbi:BTB/POZ domain and ankyrin repeat-containing protein NPR5-like isoform X1 [Phoenix dactylifera]|uniref:BTB/POZ domain and ankyrin repeat-containing protein NPR5-like isoform X1 n=1 Tax=Phoenix dactylifera TaxID=42345 RepID=A0A8B7CYE5_PHODC|nr:BTB/POZ domain and ankyrin repeat-containing protein NPR5-like isoform X1 [Phoenix dactylifera]